MKKTKLLAFLPFSLVCTFALSGCNDETETKVLRILNT